MSDELTRLRAVCGALLEYDRLNSQAYIEEMDAERHPECWDEAEDFDRLAKETLVQAVLLAREEARVNHCDIIRCVPEKKK
jgi:hypothetical protein